MRLAGQSPDGMGMVVEVVVVGAVVDVLLVEVEDDVVVGMVVEVDDDVVVDDDVLVDVVDDVEVVVEDEVVVGTVLEVVLVEVDVEVLVEVDVELLVVDDDVVLDVVVGDVVEVVEDDEVLDVVVEDVVDVLDEVLDVEDVVVMLTFGPMALQRDSARMISSTGRPGRATGGSSWTRAARTMMLVLPGVSLTICSLRMTVKTPGIVRTVLAAGLLRRGFPPRVAPTRFVEPVDPSPLDVHVVETAVAVIALRPTATSATVAVLVANPEWSSPARFPPSVDALSTPVERIVGMLMGTEVPLTGP